MISDSLFKEAIKTGTWEMYVTQSDDSISKVEPFGDWEKLVGPNSVDVTLGYHFLIPPGFEVLEDEKFYYISRIENIISNSLSINDDQSYTDMGHESLYVPLGKSIVLGPLACVLGIIRESINADNPLYGKYYAPRYNGRSTYGRMFLQSHMTAGEGDYGFKSNFVLELHNSNSIPIDLKPETRIGQIYFEHVEDNGRADITLYKGYEHTVKPCPPRTGKDRG